MFILLFHKNNACFHPSSCLRYIIIGSYYVFVSSSLHVTCLVLLIVHSCVSEVSVCLSGSEVTLAHVYRVAAI